jgi:hypothetical protein
LTGAPTLYLCAERGTAGLVKIGTCSKSGLDRFKEAFCVNPRGLDVLGLWIFPDVSAMRAAEAQAHRGLPRFETASGREWFALSREDARRHLTTLFGAPHCGPDAIPFDVDALYAGPPYDMLRERNDTYAPKGSGVRHQLKRRIWIHSEEGPDAFNKISHNTWWCYRRSEASNNKPVTYNTRRFVPVRCYEFPVLEGADWEEQVRRSNDCVVVMWQAAVDRWSADLPPALRCGWTRAGVDELAGPLIEAGMTALVFGEHIPAPRGTKDWVRNRASREPDSQILSG